MRKREGRCEACRGVNDLRPRGWQQRGANCTWEPEGLSGKHTTSASSKIDDIIRPETGRPRNERGKRDASYTKRSRKGMTRIPQTNEEGKYVSYRMLQELKLCVGRTKGYLWTRWICQGHKRQEETPHTLQQKQALYSKSFTRHQKQETYDTRPIDTRGKENQQKHSSKWEYSSTTGQRPSRRRGRRKRFGGRREKR